MCVLGLKRWQTTVVVVRHTAVETCRKPCLPSGRVVGVEGSSSSTELLWCFPLTYFAVLFWVVYSGEYGCSSWV